MKILRSSLLIFLVVLPVGILVLLRAYAPGKFKPDANMRARASLTGDNILNPGQVAGLAGKLLFVRLDGDNSAGLIRSSVDTLFIPATQLLDKQGLKIIHSHRGPVLLVSRDPDISAKTWMILSQMGCRDLYILR